MLSRNKHIYTNRQFLGSVLCESTAVLKILATIQPQENRMRAAFFDCVGNMNYNEGTQSYLNFKADSMTTVHAIFHNQVLYKKWNVK